MTPKITAIVISMVIAYIMTAISMVPPAAAQHCVTVDCQTHCWPVPGGRQCQWWCRRRCWHPAPQYIPPPVYDPPHYEEPVRHHAPGPSPGEVAIVGGVLIVILMVIAACVEGSATDAAEQDAKQTRALASKLQEAAREADQHIAAFLAQERRKERDNG